MRQTARNYGQALYDLALEENAAGGILRQLLVLQESFRTTPAFLCLLMAPNISKKERCAIVDSSFRGKVHPYVLNFIKLLTEAGVVGHFFECCAYFEDRYNADNGILPVQAVTAVPLTEGQTRKLMKTLAHITGMHIRLHCRIDPACLGGVCLHYNGKQIDGTVKTRLESLSDLLRNMVL